MNCMVKEQFSIKTSQGEWTLLTGQIINLPEDKAMLLIQQGKVSLADPEQQHTGIMQHDGGRDRIPKKSAGKDAMAVMKAEYSRFSLWLADRDMIDTGADAYNRVIDAIDHMDRLMLKGDVEGFLVAARHARYAFDDAERRGKA